jgi:DNA repair photolyase
LELLVGVTMQLVKSSILLDNGQTVEAFSPVIVSASRSTDIPAFYSDWFFHRLRVGYSAWVNPFNGVKGYVSYARTRFIVFWSKNPKPLLEHLDELKERDINCYIQYTLNDYVAEGLEKGVPSLDGRIDTFKRLVDKLGKGKVIWRFDPLILTDKISLDNLLTKIENIGEQLKGYTEKLVFSYADIAVYRKVKSNLEKSGVNYREWTQPQMLEFAKRLSELNKRWNYTLATCGEKIDIEQFGIAHNKCVDDDLMIRFAHNDRTLMEYLGVTIEQSDIFGSVPDNAIPIEGGYAVKHKNNKDKGQRAFCGCIASKDIGEYNTCPHLCEYCYANTSKEIALSNYRRIKAADQLSDTITGK